MRKGETEAGDENQCGKINTEMTCTCTCTVIFLIKHLTKPVNL